MGLESVKERGDDWRRANDKFHRGKGYVEMVSGSTESTSFFFCGGGGGVVGGWVVCLENRIGFKALRFMMTPGLT